MKNENWEESFDSRFGGFIDKYVNTFEARITLNEVIKSFITTQIDKAREEGIPEDHTHTRSYLKGIDDERARITNIIEGMKTPIEMCITGEPCEFQNRALTDLIIAITEEGV